MLDLDAIFLDVSNTLINGTFGTSIVYHRHTDTTADYDPLTGATTFTETDYDVFAGIESRNRVEEGGVGEAYELKLYLDGNTIPFVPTTSDSLTYDGILWRVVKLEEGWSSKGVIANYVFCRSD